MQEIGFFWPRKDMSHSGQGRACLTPGLMLLGRGLIGDGKHQGHISKPGYMGEHKVRVVLCSRKQKRGGGGNTGTAFSLKKDVIKKMIAVLESKEGLK